MQIGTSDPRGEGMKRSTLAITRSKVKVTGGWTQIWRPGGGIVLDRVGSSMFFSFHYVCIASPWNSLNINFFLLPTKFLQPVNLATLTIWSLFNPLAAGPNKSLKHKSSFSLKRGAVGARGAGGKGCPPPHFGWRLGKGLCPLPRKFLDFLSWNSVIWCILRCFLNFIFQSLPDCVPVLWL